MSDWAVQRDTTVISAGSTTATITAGTHYTAPASLSSAFIRIVGTRISSIADGFNQSPDTWMARIQNPGNLLTSITFETGAGAISGLIVHWEIVEYVGAGGGGNEIVVRDVDALDWGTAGNPVTKNGAVVSGAVDDAKILVLITGLRATEAATSEQHVLSVSAWETSAPDTPTFTRRNGNADAGLSYAVIEFTGANWADVQRVLHNYSAAGTTETETITAVGSTAKAFIFHQIVTPDVGADTHGAEVWLSDTTTVSFHLQSGAPVTNVGSVVWIVENTQSGGTTDMSVQRISGTRTNAESQPWTETITSVTMAEAMIAGESSRVSAGGHGDPRGSIGLELTAATTVTLDRTDNPQTDVYRFEVVTLPEEAAGGAGGGLVAKHPALRQPLIRW